MSDGGRRLAAPPARIHRAVGAARRHHSAAGAGGVALRALERLAPARVLRVQWMDVLEQRSSAGARPLAEALEGAWWAGAGDVAALGALVRGEDTVRRRLAAGDRVAAFAPDGDVIAHVWFRQGVYDEDGLLFRTAGDTWWAYDSWVHPGHRGNRLSPRLIEAAHADLAGGGATRIVYTIDRLNAPSRRAARWAGARVLGSVLGVRAPGLILTRTRWVGGRPGWRLRRRPHPVEFPGA